MSRNKIFIQCGRSLLRSPKYNLLTGAQDEIDAGGLGTTDLQSVQRIKRERCWANLPFKENECEVQVTQHRHQTLSVYITFMYKLPHF